MTDDSDHRRKRQSLRPLADDKTSPAPIADFDDNRFISIGLPSFPEGAEVIRRVSVRGVCSRHGKALMIKYKWPGYGFPGGGIEAGETPEEAMVRELREEVGYTVTRVGRFFLSVTERTTSKSHPGKYFEQINLYYECEVADGPDTPQPTPEEADREYECAWVDLSEALKENAFIPERKRDVAVLHVLVGQQL